MNRFMASSSSLVSSRIAANTCSKLQLQLQQSNSFQFIISPPRCIQQQQSKYHICSGSGSGGTMVTFFHVNNLQYNNNGTQNGGCRFFSATQQSSIKSSDYNSSSNAVFRTEECDPVKHTERHHGLFYTIPKEIASRLFVLGGFDKEQQFMLKCFRETAIMIRESALEIINYLNKTNFDKPPNRFVLYGPIGSGKSYTLNHLLHYGYNRKFILIYCGRPTDWIRFPQEYSVSPNNPKRLNTPLDAAIWLQHFKAQNFNLLEELNLTSQNNYTWSQREQTNKGDSLLSIVEHGINRINHASDCMAVLLKELKLNAKSGNCRLMVVAEKVNAFYEPSRLLYPDRTYATVDDITIARAFKKFFNKDWKNGTLIASVDKKLVVPYRLLPIHGTKKVTPRDRTYKNWGPFTVHHLSDYPRDLLTDQGFHDLDPFIPIEVKRYSEKEATSCLDYYHDRKWLQHPAADTDEGRAEIKFVNGYNPLHMYQFCAKL